MSRTDPWSTWDKCLLVFAMACIVFGVILQILA
jgi:hypothetical protein